MQKKFTEEKLIEIIETGITEFAERGVEGANINTIAKKAGVSIGVIYKYYKDKDGFFLACVERSLDELRKVLDDELGSEEKLLGHAEKIIRTVQKYSREHSNYINMYHEITSGSNKRYAKFLAEQIEGISAKVYTDYIKEAKERGEIRQDMSPEMLAFFFDNLLMMMQFSYSSEYYKERFKVYCGENILEDDNRVVEELVKFIESAFTFDEGQVIHGKW